MLIIHDEGKIIATISGEYVRPAAIVADIPEGYYAESVDVTTGEIIFAKNPKTDAERIAELEAQMATLVGSEQVIE